METLFKVEAGRGRGLYDGKQFESKSISTGQEYLARGTYRILMKKNAEGKADLEQAAKLDASTASTVYQTLGTLAQGQKDWTARLAAYRHWSEATPDSAEALNSYA